MRAEPSHVPSVVAAPIRGQATTRRSVASPSARRRHVVYVAHDANDSRVLHRAHALAGNDIDLTLMAFRRDKVPLLTGGFWQTVDLGQTFDYAYGHRILSMGSAALIVWRHRRELAHVDGLIARNIEQLLLARLVRLLAGWSVPLTYECLDVHRLMIGTGFVSRVMRRIERWLLGSCDLLVVSSQAFVDYYFRPQQGFTGRWKLVENKLPESFTTVTRPPTRTAPTARPLIIGWFGMLRCMKSFNMLLELADARPGSLRIVMRGMPTEVDVAGFCARIGDRANVVYGGPFRNPEDLDAIYRDVDLMWAIDYYEEGFCSEWLLPNRLYEAGFYGVPLLTRSGTASAARTLDLGIGWALTEPMVESTLAFLDELSAPAFAAVAQRVAETPRAVFVEDGEAATLLNEMLVPLACCLSDRG